jgi:hypothetical protein
VSLIETFGKLRARSWREIALATEALLLLGVFRAAILLLPFRRITAMMGLVQVTPDRFSGGTPVAAPEQFGWALQAAAARTPWESACLVQALAGMVMLSRRNVSSTLYLGVAKDASGSEAMAAHAWLRSGNSIVTGGAGSERYAAISSFCRSVPSAAESPKAPR